MLTIMVNETETCQDGERLAKAKRKAIWVCDLNVDGKKKLLQTKLSFGQTATCHVDVDTIHAKEFGSFASRENEQRRKGKYSTCTD